MATVSGSDDKISCCLCLDVFKNPRCLFCGHSFCSKCLQDYINKNHQNNEKQINCPFCKLEVQIPDTKKPVETWAAQFPINIALVDSINERQRSKTAEKGDNISFLKSVTESLKSFKEILQSEMDERTEKLRQEVDINIVNTAEEVKMIGDKLINNFTDAVHKEEDRLIKEIEKFQITVDSEIEELFTEHKHLIDENEKMIRLGEELIKSRSESDIKTNIPKFSRFQNIISEFQAKSPSETEKSKLRIILRKPQNQKTISVHIGEITSDIQTETQLERLRNTLKHRDTENTETFHTDTRRDRIKGILNHTETIKTKIVEDTENPLLVSILVSGEDSNRIVVSDWNNECVKCFCLERKSMINNHVTFCRAWGLAESRDQHGLVVIAVALPFEKAILFLTLENFKLIKSVSTNKRYWFVAVLPGNRLAVTGLYSGQYLDILTDSGQLINSISGDLIPSPSRLTVHDQCLIVVSKRKKVNSLFCVTPSGDVKWESRDSGRLKDLTGVTCDREGNVLVCDFRRNCVVQLSRNGKVLRDIITDPDELFQPTSLCCHGNKLYVGQRKTGKIKIFTLCRK